MHNLITHNKPKQQMLYAGSDASFDIHPEKEVALF